MYNPTISNLPSVERKPGEYHGKIPRLSNQNHNHAYIGVVGENADQIGSLGLKRAEKELI